MLRGRVSATPLHKPELSCASRPSVCHSCFEVDRTNILHRFFCENCRISPHIKPHAQLQFQYLLTALSLRCLQHNTSNDGCAIRSSKIYCFLLAMYKWALGNVDQKWNSSLKCGAAEYQVDRPCEKVFSIAWSQTVEEYPTDSETKEG